MSDAHAPAGSVGNPIVRRAARVLLVNGAGRLLMFRGFDPARPRVRYWFTVGGGLDEGESPAEGAVRELREETGLALDAQSLGEPMWHEVANFPFDGRWYRQEQDFFAVRVASWDVEIAGLDAIERESIDKHHWWSLAELTSTTEQFYPSELPDLMREILAP